MITATLAEVVAKANTNAITTTSITPMVITMCNSLWCVFFTALSDCIKSKRKGQENADDYNSCVVAVRRAEQIQSDIHTNSLLCVFV